MNKITHYTTTAKWFHWISAILVFFQLSSGIWMTQAIQNITLRSSAWKMYQNHKSIGILLLLLTIIRIFWRIKNPPPDHKKWLQDWEAKAANIAHKALYTLLLLTPLLGWLMVSSSPLKIPTILLNWLDWPHIPIPEKIDSLSIYQWSKTTHQVSGIVLGIIVGIHLTAALKHHFYDKNSILKSMTTNRIPQ